MAEVDAQTLSTTHSFHGSNRVLAWPPSNPIDDKVAAPDGKPVKGLVLGQVRDLFRRATHRPSGWIGRRSGEESFFRPRGWMGFETTHDLGKNSATTKIDLLREISNRSTYSSLLN